MHTYKTEIVRFYSRQHKQTIHYKNMPLKYICVCVCIHIKIKINVYLFIYLSQFK